MAGTKSMEQRLDEWWEKHYGDTYGQEIAEDAPQEVEEEPPRFVSFGEGPETLVQLTPNLDDPDVVGRSDNAYQGSLKAMAQYGDSFIKFGQQYDVDPYLLASIAGLESGGNADAVGPTNDLGLMQFTPGAWQDMMPGRSLDERLDPHLSIEAAAKLIVDNRNSLKSEDLAVLAYNVGRSKVRQIISGESEFPGKSRYYWPVVTLTYERLRQTMNKQE